MGREYSLEQFPKNKDIDHDKLNEYQVVIRDNQKKYVYGKEKTCSKCHKKQPICEFYITNKDNGRRKTYCRDCQMREAGVVEIGKCRFSSKIEKKGFRRCSVCKTIKPLSEFKKNKGRKNGISHNCYDCSHKLHHEFIMKQKDEIGDYYVRQYCLKNYGHAPASKKGIDKYRDEIKEKRKPKYHLDGKSFKTVTEIARYIKEIYNIPITTTEKRINTGKTLEECKLSESQMRSKAYTKGSVKVTDTITKQTFYFTNSSDKELRKMFSGSAINRAIKTGSPTTITSLSKYRNPCVIERINQPEQ